MNFFVSLFNGLKSNLLALITGMSSFLMMLILWCAGEALLLALCYKLSLGVFTMELFFGGVSAVFTVAADHYRSQVITAVKGLATKLLT